MNLNPTPVFRNLPPDAEVRTCQPIELRADAQAGDVLEGYAAVFNQETDIMGLWKEKVRAGAFLDTLKRGDSVYALFNHDVNLVLAKNQKADGSSGGLKMHEDRTGLKVTIIPVDTPTGNEVKELIRGGYVDKMSFAFIVEDEVWSRKDGMDVREITKVRLFDVSPVTFPAYQGTSISARAQEARAAFAATLDATPPAGGPTPDDQPTGRVWEVDIEAERLRNLEVHRHGV